MHSVRCRWFCYKQTFGAQQNDNHVLECSSSDIAKNGIEGFEEAWYSAVVGTSYGLLSRMLKEHQSNIFAVSFEWDIMNRYWFDTCSIKCRWVVYLAYSLRTCHHALVHQCLSMLLFCQFKFVKVDQVLNSTRVSKNTFYAGVKLNWHFHVINQLNCCSMGQ